MARPPSDEDFADLVHAAWPSLYRTAYLLLGDAAEAEDLTQTALAKTYASWGRVREPAAARGYARTVLVNTATSWFRRRSWRNELPTETLPERPAPEVGDDDRPVLLAALARLAPRQRAVVVLRFYDDLSVAETARALGVTEGTVKSQTSVALDRLRAVLGESFLQPSDQGATHD